MVIEGTTVTEDAIVVVTLVNNIQRVRLYLDCVKLLYVVKYTPPHNVQISLILLADICLLNMVLR
jgi:hypothetical protein